MVFIFGEARQNTPAIVPEGQNRGFRLTRDGRQPDWRESLILEGYAWRVTVGTIAAGGDVTLITGGGNGTTIDQDQPEVVIGCPATHAIIPMRIKVATQIDLDADGEEGNIIVATDLASSGPTSVTGTTETPTNMLSALSTETVPTGSTAFSAVTADITDPTVSEILAFETVQASHAGAAASQSAVAFGMDYRPDGPSPIWGASGAAMYVYWGGTAALPGIAIVEYALVPKARLQH